MIEGSPVSAEKVEVSAEAWPRLESGNVASDHAYDSTVPSQHDPHEGAIPLPDSIVPGAKPAGAALRSPRLEKGWPGATGSLLAHIAVVTALLIFSPWSDSGLPGDQEEITIELVEASPPEQAVGPRESAPAPSAAEPQATSIEAPLDTPSPASPEIKEEQPPPEPPPPEQNATVEAQPEQPAPVVVPPPQPAPEASAAAEPQLDQPALVPVPLPQPPATAAPVEEPSAAPPPAPMPPPPPAPALPPPVKVERPQPPAARPPTRPPEQVAREAREKAEAAARERAAQAKREEEAKAARELAAQAKREQGVKTAALEAQERAEASAKAQANQAAAQAYRGAVVGHLAAFKRYPPAARARGSQGNPVVAFSLDAAGRVISVSLTRGSGDAEIDAEVVAMVRRASPFPAPPSGAPRAFSAPINFRLQ
jgi:TonB family protein